MKQKQADQIAVTKIEIKIGGKTLSLTPEQMKELKEILNETFPDPVPVLPTQPIIIERPYYRDWPWRKWELTWGGNTSGTTMCLASSGGSAQ